MSPCATRSCRRRLLRKSSGTLRASAGHRETALSARICIAFHAPCHGTAIRSSAFLAAIPQPQIVYQELVGNFAYHPNQGSVPVTCDAHIGFQGRGIEVELRMMYTD